MQRSTNFFILLLIFAGLLLASCAPKMIARTQAGIPDTGRNLLIATKDSQFKNAVVSSLVSEFEKQAFIEIMDLRALPRTATDKYQAIVILSDYRMFRYNANVRKFLAAANEATKQKVLLLTTAGSPHRLKDMPDVDGIGSASELDDQDDVSQAVVAKVQDLLDLK